MIGGERLDKFDLETSSGSLRPDLKNVVLGNFFSLSV